MDIKQALKYINCNENEINTFLSVLNQENGITVVQLSRKLNLPRPTIYGHLNSLIEKGLVKKALIENGSKFFAEDLETVTKIFDEQNEKIKQAKSSLKESFKKQNTASYQPKFVIFDTPNSAESIFRDILRTNKETFWFWPIEEMIKTINPDVIDSFNKERLIKNINLYVLWPENKKVDIKKNKFMGSSNPKKSLREIRILPENIDFTMGYGIYDNKVAFISSQRENYGYVIDSKELSETMKNHFDYFWNISKKYISN